MQTVQSWIGAVLRGGNWRFADPEGVSQETLARLLRTARSGRVQDPESFQKFVYTVAKNTCVDVYHREQRRRQHEQPEREDADPPDEGASPDDAIDRRQRLDALVYIAQRLPESCRQLWAWVYGDEMSAAQVAERLGITDTNVRVRVHRCLETARKIARQDLLVPRPVACGS